MGAFDWVGDAIGGAAALLGGESANQTNERLSAKQMEFQKMMSGTAYRRAMHDMKLAGLNPILAGKLGGASTPGGSMPVIHDSLTPAVTTALSSMQTRSNVDKQESEVTRIQYEIEQIDEATNLTKEQKYKVSQEIANLEQELSYLKEQTTAAEYSNQQNEILTKFYTSNEFAKIANDLQINGQILKIIIGAFFSRKK